LLLAPLCQGTFGIIQGTFGIIQGTFDIIQGTSDIIQGTFAIIQGLSDIIQGTFGIIQGTLAIIQGTFDIIRGTLAIYGSFGITQGTFGLSVTWRKTPKRKPAEEKMFSTSCTSFATKALEGVPDLLNAATSRANSSNGGCDTGCVRACHSAPICRIRASGCWVETR
jgi:hypothetical protein